MEECAEVIHASSKVLKRGRHGVEKQYLSEEVGDLQAIIGLMIDQGLIDMQTARRKKNSTENKYRNLKDGWFPRTIPKNTDPNHNLRDISLNFMECFPFPLLKKFFELHEIRTKLYLNIYRPLKS